MRMRHGLTDSTAGMNMELKFCICAWSTAIYQRNEGMMNDDLFKSFKVTTVHLLWCQITWERIPKSETERRKKKSNSWERYLHQKLYCILPAFVWRHQPEAVWSSLGHQIQRDTCTESPHHHDPEDTEAQNNGSYRHHINKCNTVSCGTDIDSRLTDGYICFWIHVTYSFLISIRSSNSWM